MLKIINLYNRCRYWRRSRWSRCSCPPHEWISSLKVSYSRRKIRQRCYEYSKRRRILSLRHEQKQTKVYRPPDILGRGKTKTSKGCYTRQSESSYCKWAFYFYRPLKTSKTTSQTETENYTVTPHNQPETPKTSHQVYTSRKPALVHYLYETRYSGWKSRNSSLSNN